MKDSTYTEETVSVLGGLLVQDEDVAMEEQEDWQVVTDRKPTAKGTSCYGFCMASGETCKVKCDCFGK